MINAQDFIDHCELTNTEFAQWYSNSERRNKNQNGNNK